MKEGKEEGGGRKRKREEGKEIQFHYRMYKGVGKLDVVSI